MTQVAPLIQGLQAVETQDRAAANTDARIPNDSGSSPVTARKPSRYVATSSAAVVIQAVALGPVGFVFAWTGICALHAVCAAYLIAAGRVYTVLGSTQVYSMMELFQLSLDASYFPSIAHFHYALASVHVYFLVKPIVIVVAKVCIPTKARERLTTSFESMARRSSSITASRTFSSKPLIIINIVRLQLTRVAKRAYHLLLARDGLFGVHSDHFELFFLGREVVETVLQTYQGYMMSRLLPRERLNSFYTLILVINCWTTPLLRRVCGGNRTLERLLVVLCDVVLDFVSSIGVPVAVAIGYIQQYDPETTDFSPWTLSYEDVWLLNFMNETPIVVFGSWLDVASRLVFSLGLLVSMEDVKSLIVRRPRLGPAAKDTTDSRSKSSQQISPSPIMASSSAAKAVTPPDLQAAISRWVHRMMVLWGIGVGAMYLEAHVRASPSHCSLALRPWLVANPACAVVTIDCRKEQGLTGKSSDFDAVFSNLDAGSVEYVIFRHCRQVEMAPPFMMFRNLYGFKSYNSTIQAWDKDAGFTATAHPRVRFAYFISTQFVDAALPRGLYHPNFPTTLTDIEISGSNLEFIPDTLPWPQSMTIYVESSQIVEFPMALVHVKPYALSLAFNKLTFVPAEAIMEPDIVVFYFRGNPIMELPATGVDITQLHDTGSGLSLGWLLLEYTNISSLPEWVTEQFVDQVQIRAAQSPLCSQILLNTSSPERDSMLEERPWLAQVAKFCLKDPGPVVAYPVELEAE